MPLYLLARPSKKRGGTATKGLHDYMHKRRNYKPTYANSTAPQGAVPCYPAEAPQEFDEEGKELGPDAQVWKTYVREADLVDEELVDGWNKSTDVILIFAALFSAISTAFVIESYKNLKPDSADSSSQTLLTISQTLMFIANGSQPSNAPLTSEAETPVFKASAKAICVNVLWFMSLSLSVAVSLISMLAKEWCLEFMAGRTGPPGAQARRRQQRWDGMVRWRMKEVITMLPSLIHLSLLLFAIGLCVFLWDVHYGVAIPVVIITTISAGIYFACTIVPFIYDYCPYGTVLSRLIKQFKSIPSQLNRSDVPHDGVTTRAIHWLIVNCETPRSVDVAYQSLAAADENLPAGLLETCDTWAVIKRRLEAHTLDQSEQSQTAAQLYKRALEVYPLTRRKIDLLDYGSDRGTRRLEQLVLGIQATIKSKISELLSRMGPEDDRIKQILMCCTLIGPRYLAEANVTPSIDNQSYRYAMEVEPVPLAENIIELLEQHLKIAVNLDPLMFSTLFASFAFLMCCSTDQGDTADSVRAGHLLRLIQGYQTGEYNISYQLRESFADHVILGALWFWTSRKYWWGLIPSTFGRHSGRVTALEILWDGLMDTLCLDESALKRHDKMRLTHGLRCLIANPNRFNISQGDFYSIWDIIIKYSLNSSTCTTEAEISYYTQYIRDISNDIVTSSNVTAFTPQLFSVIAEIISRSPRGDERLLLTPEIYMFGVRHLSLTSDLDSQESWCAYQILENFPITGYSPWLLHQLFIDDFITHLSNSINGDLPKQIFATAQLWLLFNTSLHHPDRSSPGLNTLEQALLNYPGLGNNLDRQEEVMEELEIKLAVLLDQVESRYKLFHLKEYAYRMLEVMLQHRCAPLPELASRGLADVPENLRGIKSTVNFKT